MVRGGYAAAVKSEVKPKPQDLTLPREALQIGPRYTIPKEFIKLKEEGSFDSFVNIDEHAPVFSLFDGFSDFPDTSEPDGMHHGGIFKGIGGFLGTVVTLGGVTQKPRNFYNILTHTYDYSSGGIERKILSSEDPKQYTLMDQEWIKAQQSTTYFAIAASTASMLWSGTKNVDGSGRTPVRKVLPIIAWQTAVFLTGGTMAAQHRALQGDGLSSTKAYSTAIFPLTGWPLTFHDKDHSFGDYIYGDAMTTAVDGLWSQYTARLRGMAAVSAYAGFFPADILPYVQNVVEEKFGSLQKARSDFFATSQELQRLQAKPPVIGVSPDAANVKALRDYRAKIANLQSELATLDKTIGNLESWEASVSRAAGGVPLTNVSSVRKLTTVDVKNMAKGLWREKAALETIEEARNERVVFSSAEEATLTGRSKLSRFGYGAIRGFTDGRWRVRLTSYTATASLGYLETVATYHIFWDKSWEESFIAGASIFWTIIPNEPWVGALKAVGVKKIPVALQPLPSTLGVNLLWSVTKWDRDIMLQRCKMERSNLVHSMDPGYRQSVRERMDKWYSLANPKEKANWDKPVSEGGCGMPPPEK